MYIVYQITNKNNGKSYVGLTNSSLKKRWYQHRYDATHSNSKLHFHCAIRKHDITDWTLDTLCCCLTKSDAEYFERHFIKEHNTYVSGYNMTEGGNAFGGLRGRFNGMWGRTHTAEVREKLSNLATTRFKSKSYEDLYGSEKATQLKQQRSVSVKKHKLANPPTGIKNANAKRYQLLSPSGDEYIVEGNLRSFCKEHSLDVGSVIQVAKGRRQTYKGWRVTSVRSVHHIP